MSRSSSHVAGDTFTFQDAQWVGNNQYRSAPAILLHPHPQRETKALHITDVCVFAAQDVQENGAIELLNQCNMCPCPITGTQPWRRMATSSCFLPGATVPCTPYHSPTICLFRADNHILSQKYISLLPPTWQLQQNTEKAARMNVFAHHINSWKKRLCKYFIFTAVGFDLGATSVAVLSPLKAFKYTQVWHVRLIAM